MKVKIKRTELLRYCGKDKMAYLNLPEELELEGEPIEPLKIKNPVTQTEYELEEKKEKRCTKCNNFFANHHKRYSTSDGVYHGRCYGKLQKKVSGGMICFPNCPHCLDKDIPMGVSQWLEYGKKYGYDTYFIKKTKEERKSEKSCKHPDPCKCNYQEPQKIMEIPFGGELSSFEYVLKEKINEIVRHLNKI